MISAVADENAAAGIDCECGGSIEQRGSGGTPVAGEAANRTSGEDRYRAVACYLTHLMVRAIGNVDAAVTRCGDSGDSSKAGASRRAAVPENETLSGKRTDGVILLSPKRDGRTYNQYKD
jgi:hypothetical protein